MERKYKIMVASMGAVAIIAAAAATSAFAASRVLPEISRTAPAAQVGISPVTTPTDADYQAWGCPVANGNYEAIAKLLGMTTEDLQSQLEQGKSLVEIAASKGVSEDTLVATIFTPMKEYMQQQVTSGRWTQAQLDSHLKLAEQHVRQLVNAKGDGANNWGCGGGGMMGGWGANGTTPGGNSSSYGRGGMMGGAGYGRTGGGMMGGGFGGMMGGWN